MIKKKFKTVFILTVLFSIAIYLYKNAVFMVTENAAASFSAYTTTAIYSALDEVIDENTFEDIVKTVYDGNGDIVYVGTDVLRVNSLIEKLSEKTLILFGDYLKSGVEVRAGAFSGVRLLSGVGGNVKIRLMTVTNVKCEFRTEYTTLGINQTMRRLYLTIKPSYSVVMPFYRKDEMSSADILVYDDLIVGKIPQFYINAS